MGVRLPPNREPFFSTFNDLPNESTDIMHRESSFPGIALGRGYLTYQPNLHNLCHGNYKWKQIHNQRKIRAIRVGS